MKFDFLPFSKSMVTKFIIIKKANTLLSNSKHSKLQFESLLTTPLGVNDYLLWSNPEQAKSKQIGVGQTPFDKLDSK